MRRALTNYDFVIIQDPGKFDFIHFKDGDYEPIHDRMCNFKRHYFVVKKYFFLKKVKASYWRSENVVYSSISMFLFIGLLHWEGNIYDLVFFMILVKIILQTIHNIYSILWLTKILDSVIAMCKLLILKYWLNSVQTKCIIDKKTM